MNAYCCMALLNKEFELKRNKTYNANIRGHMEVREQRTLVSYEGISF